LDHKLDVTVSLYTSVMLSLQKLLFSKVSFLDYEFDFTVIYTFVYFLSA